MPYELRPYAWNLVRYINKELNIQSACEIGCGLGDIIRNIRAEQKIGVDASESVIACAKFLDQQHKENQRNTDLYVGLFGEEIPIPTIDLLITVNFIHGISPDDLRSGYARILEHSKVKHIMIRAS